MKTALNHGRASTFHPGTVAALLLALFVTPIAVAAEGSENICFSPEARRYPEMGRPMGLIIPDVWIEEHAAEVHEMFVPSCERFTKCLTVWGNPIEFCRDLLAVEVRALCTSTWPSDEERENRDLCRTTAEVFAVTQTKQARMVWAQMQRSGRASYESRQILAPRVELDPPSPEAGDGFDLIVRAWDAESGLPRYGLVLIGGRDKGLTFQKIGFRFQFDHTRDEYGRISFTLPTVTLRPGPVSGSGFPGFPEVTVAFTSRIPESTLAFEPPADRWHEGTNTIRVTAVDSISGAAIEGSILTPGQILGRAGSPVTVPLQASEDGLCGDPVWFRAQLMDHPDASLPITPCR